MIMQSSSPAASPSLRDPWDAFLHPLALSMSSCHPPITQSQSLNVTLQNPNPNTISVNHTDDTDDTRQSCRPSLAQVLNDMKSQNHQILESVSTNLQPIKKGEYFSVSIDEDLCQSSLIRRLILSKGDKPWRLVDLRARLSKAWGIENN